MTTTTPSTASVSTESPSRSSHKAYTFLWFAVSAATGALIMTEQWTQYGMYFVSALYLATVTPALARRTTPTTGTALLGSMGIIAAILVLCSGGFHPFGLSFTLPDYLSAITGGFMLASALTGWGVLHWLRRTVQDPWMDTLNTKLVIGSAAASGVFLSEGWAAFACVLPVTVLISDFIANRNKTPNPNLILAAGTLINAAAILTALALRA